jgi:serine protease Do
VNLRTAAIVLGGLLGGLLGALPAVAQGGSSLGGRSTLGSNDPAGEPAVQAALRSALATAEPFIVEIESLGGIPEKFVAPKTDAEKDKGILAKRGFKQAFGPSTGLIVSSDGLIATSTFVLSRKPRFLIVTLSDDRSFLARELGRDDSRALALLKIEAKDLPVARLCTAAEIKVGRFAMAAGRGLGTKRPSVSLGIVSGLGRVGGRAMQSSALISPVNYGGPLVALDGSVLGLLVPLAIRGGMAGVDIYDSGIGFAVPAPDLKTLIARLRSPGVKLEAGWLGIGPDSAPRDTGVRLARVADGSPAKAAGLKEGDVILEVDGEPVSTPWQLKQALAKRFAGETVKLKVAFHEKVRQVEVKLKTAPAESGAPHGPTSRPAPGGDGR